jgi:signal transduction histidine kinase
MNRSDRNQVCRRPFRLWPLRLVFAVLLAPVWIVCPAVGASDSKRVLILHSFGRDFKPWSEYGKAIRTELVRQSSRPIDIIEHDLVSARSGDEDQEDALVQYLRAMFAKNPLDLIVSIGAPASAFVQRHRVDLFAETPMVLTAIDQRRVQTSSLTINDAVVAVRINYLAAFENILRVLPDTENIVVVVGTSPIEKFWKEAIAKEVEPLNKRIKLSWTDHLSFNELLKNASTLPPRSAIFWELMIVDAAGVVHEGSAAMAKLHNVANAPIFSYDESFFGRETVGGPFLRVADTGRETAAVSARILGGERAGDIKVPPVQFGRPMFDWREVQRWGIDERRLPEGSEIHFREPTVWERYRLPILAACLALLLQAALIQWLLYERRQRRQSEAISRTTLSELAHVNRLATGNELSASITHEVMQPLTGMVSSANAGLRWLSGPAPDVERAQAMLGQIVAAGHRAADVVRAIRSIFKHDADSDQPVVVNGLILIVLDLVRDTLSIQDVEVETQLDDNLPEIPANAIQLQQVFLNLIVNAIDAMKTMPIGQRRLLRVRTWIEAGGIGVSVEDTGPGVAPEMLDQIFKPLFTTKNEGLGLGLSICRSIIDAHHGRIRASLKEPHGLAVHVYLPVIKPRS